MSDTDRPAPLTITEAATRLEAARAAMQALRDAVLAGASWPLAEDFGTGPEASWGPREVLAHLAEMLPFWLGEFERVAEAGRPPAAPHPFGRTAGDAMRLGILERDRTLPLPELLARVDVGIDRWLARLPTVTPEEGSARGLHPRDGEVPATWIRDRYVIGHLEEHVTQLDEVLAAGAGAAGGGATRRRGGVRRPHPRAQQPAVRHGPPDPP
jgi:hypothetical protein